MAKRRDKYSKGIAARIIRLRDQGGNVPPHIVRAANRVSRGRGSYADKEMVRQFLWIKERGARDVRNFVNSGSRFAGKIAVVGIMAQQVENGGPGSAAAAFSLGQYGLDAVDKVMAMRPVKAFMEQTALMVGADPVNAARAGYVARAGARMGGAIGLGTAAAAYGLMKATSTLEAQYRGYNYETRVQGQADLVQRAVAERLTPRQMQIQRDRQERMRMELKNPFLQYVMKPLGYMGTEIGEKAKAAGERARLENRVMVGSFALERAKNEYLQDSYGALFGLIAKRAGNAFQAVGGIDVFTASATKRLEDKLDRKKQLNAALDSYVSQGRFAEARLAATETKREFQTEKWRDPAKVYAAEESVRNSARLWAWQRTPRAASREGD